ncbi:MAG: sel1 repeat family protein [Lachnospiraceae bacterium]|nr:sel1 repeat family protein [Lachnospiraceae bacterium]
MGLFSRKETEGVDSKRLLAIANELLAQGSYEEAFGFYKVMAESGNVADAQFNLAICYATGKGCNKDYFLAARWFQQAYVYGIDDAQNCIKKVYSDYILEVLDKPFSYEDVYEKTVDFVRLAQIDENDEEQANELLCSAGKHCLYALKDHIKARILFRTSAEFGHYAEGQNGLGIIYCAGVGIEKSDVVALYWWNKAEEQGHELARKDALGLIEYYTERMTDEEFEEMLLPLVNWCKTGTEHIPKDLEKAAYWEEMLSEENTIRFIDRYAAG